MTSILEKKQKKREKYSLDELKTLGCQLLSSRAHINNLPLLLTFIRPSSPPQYALESLLSLQSFFIPVISGLPSSSKSHPDGDGKSNKDPELVYRTWLRSKFDEFLKAIIVISVYSESDESLRDVALDAVMEFVKLGKGGRFQSAIYYRFLHAIVNSKMLVDFLIDLLSSKFFKYADVCYFTYISLEKLSNSLDTTNTTDSRNMSLHGDDDHMSLLSNVDLSIKKLHCILSRISSLKAQDGESDYEMWSELGFFSKEAHCKGSSKNSIAEEKEHKMKKSNDNVLSTSYITRKMKLKFTKAWISFLRLPMPLDLYNEVLVSLHQVVIPHLSNPVILCDFLTRSYDIGGVISVMALSSLYILMTQHGLDYPNFYEKLYALLLPSIFMAKHRAKFFELLDSCLKSPLLPAYLAAAFAKKLSRLALSVPPSGELVIIALLHNLLRRHPSINFLVHLEADDETDRDALRNEIGFNERAKDNTGPDVPNRKTGIDLFNYQEMDPAKSKAMRSSLWEIDTLRHHYCPAVSRFVLSLGNDLTVRSKTTEITVKDFTSGSYATIFREELRRRIKQVPLAFYKSTPTFLFPDSDFVGWSFKGDKCEKQDGKSDISMPNEDFRYNSVKRQRVEDF